MSQGTRSRKIRIAEDHTALTATVNPPPDATLANLPTLSNAMPPVEPHGFDIDASIRSLKATYKATLGTVRKSKNQKKLPEVSPANMETVPIQSHTADMTVNRREPLSASTNNVSRPNTRSTRSTRQQPTLQGQSQTPPADSMQQARFPEDYTLSLFSGRAIASPQPYYDTLSFQLSRSAALADNYWMLVQEELAPESTASSAVNTVASVELSPSEANKQSPESTKYLRSEGKPNSQVKSPIKTLEEVERDLVLKEAAAVVQPETDDSDDSFVVQITSRSPAKPVSRIEDSVEALDELEDAYEALDEAVLAGQLASPAKSRTMVSRLSFAPVKDNKIVPGDSRASPRADSTGRASSSARPQLKSGYASMRVKTTAPKAPVLKRATSMNLKTPQETTTKEVQTKVQPARRVPASRPLSLLPPREPSKKTRQPIQYPNFELPGEVRARKMREQREAHSAGGSSEAAQLTRATSAPRTKSTKPLTKPTFELPGEAYSRRKKEALEAKLKLKEEEERQRREFKAKPVRKSIAPAPRDTIASRARQGVMDVDNTERGQPQPGKRESIYGTPFPVAQSRTTAANVSVIRSPSSGSLQRKLSTRPSGPSVPGTNGQRVSSNDVQFQRQRAKEIYNRDLRAIEDIEREKREREAAAKRSREEAAERGRQASREWAERQRMRQMMEGDKGLGIGYGPGGQMGLRG